MAQIFKTPTRMCVVCRKRYAQKELLRLQCDERIGFKLVSFSGQNRSFYLCDECIEKQKFGRYLLKICKTDKEKIINQLKELVLDVKNKN